MRNTSFAGAASERDYLDRLSMARSLPACDGDGEMIALLRR